MFPELYVHGLSKRRAYRLTTPFEALASNSEGEKVRGTAYRHGSRLTGDACCILFRDFDSAGNDQRAAAQVRDPAICAAVRHRLSELLNQDDIDLLYLRHVAGWSQADIARRRHCQRSTICRREMQVLEKVRADPEMQRLAGWRLCPPSQEAAPAAGARSLLAGFRSCVQAS